MADAGVLGVPHGVDGARPDLLDLRAALDDLAALDEGEAAPAGDKVEVGAVAGQEIELVLALRMPARAGGSITARMSLTDRDDAIEATEPVLEWKAVASALASAERADIVVQRAVARAYASKARREAAEFNRNGDLKAARKVLESTARRIAMAKCCLPATPDPPSIQPSLETFTRSSAPAYTVAPTSSG